MNSNINSTLPVLTPPTTTATAIRVLKRAASLAMMIGIMNAAPPALGASLKLTVHPAFLGEPLQLGSLRYTNAAGQTLSVTRLSYLLSGFTLERSDGTWLVLTNTVAWMDVEKGRSSIRLADLPAGRYRRVSFHVGLDAAANHADPAEFPAGHPLNPNLNGLHWSWQGGYVFMALEGAWSKPESKQSGYSYHIANDRLLMTVVLPVALDLAADCELRLALNVDQIFSGKHHVHISDNSASTHSRVGDELADQLRENIERAFTADAVSVAEREKTEAKESTDFVLLIASNATPYRLAVSSFFPRPALPLDNPLTQQGVELGRRLFHDPLLSWNGKQSCASCHQAEAAFTDAGERFSLGVEGQRGPRNAMPLFNLAWKSSFFWDGRAATLREQVLMPIQNPIEMHETLSNLVAKLESAHHSQLPIEPSLLTSAATNEMDYPALFARAFGTRDITTERIARALEQFLLVQVSHDSKFDQSLNGEVELTDEEKRGFALFHTEYDPRKGVFGADCFHCHGGPLFQSQNFANNGLDEYFTDLGRYLVTRKVPDKGKFSVPSLRNVALTAPYMHDGRFATLEQVVEHYSTGVKRSATLDPNLAKHPDGGVPLSAADKRSLIAFLKTLTDERFNTSARRVARFR